MDLLLRSDRIILTSMKKVFLIILLLVLGISYGCEAKPASNTDTSPAVTPAPSLSQKKSPVVLKSREESLSVDAVKMTPETDDLPPILHSDNYYPPVPLGNVINTAGAEDSPFVTNNGKEFYFFFTPDANIPVEEQLFDGVTGVYVSRKTNDGWGPAERVILQDENELSLDGAVCVRDDEMWFASARQGNYRGVDMWIADRIGGEWADWRNAGAKLNVEYEIGEVHITADGSELYFHSGRAGGKGNYDIWVSRKLNGDWQLPENIEAVNSPETDGWPYVTVDGSELWFTRIYMGSPGIFVSRKNGRKWGEPELVISQFAGEPTLDTEGNVYFVHHFIRDGVIIDADIYSAMRK
jgi:hypothetical protein